MPPNVLITGGSGYLGGTILSRLRAVASSSPLPLSTTYAATRSNQHSAGLEAYGVKSLVIDFTDHAAVASKIRDLAITVVFFLIDAYNSEVQVTIIKALADVQRRTGSEVHFLHTSGAKLFSEWADFPVDKPIGDADKDVYKLQKAAKPNIKGVATAVGSNNKIIDIAEEFGVRSYIFIPCIVYGRGEGFGNKISIQTTAVVNAAKAAGRGFDVNKGRPGSRFETTRCYYSFTLTYNLQTWPVSSVRDTVELYIQILRSILAGKNPSYGPYGYYLASSGNIAWVDLYAAIAKPMAKRGAVPDAKVHAADDDDIKKIGKAMGVLVEIVGLQIGGHCALVPEQGAQIGWKSKDSAEHILESADAEVKLILDNSK